MVPDVKRFAIKERDIK